MASSLPVVKYAQILIHNYTNLTTPDFSAFIHLCPLSAYSAVSIQLRGQIEKNEGQFLFLSIGRARVGHGNQQDVVRMTSPGFHS